MRETRAMIAAVLIAGTAVDGSAQVRQMELRLDSLALMAARTRAAVQAYDDSVQRIGRAIDTAHSGTPLVVAGREIIEPTSAIAPVVVDSVAAVVGQAMSRLAGYSFRVHVERHAGWGRGRDTTAELAVSVVRPNGAQMRAWRAPVDSTSLAATLLHAMTYATFAAVDPAFFAWTGNAIPDDTLLASEWAAQRLLLVSAPSAVGGRCYRGDRDACRIALLLSPVSDPILEWHDSATRRELVRAHGPAARRMDARAEQQCLAGSDAACVALLRLLPPETTREPAPVRLRIGLLRHALHVGGAGAIERMLTGSAQNPAARLEAAAGVPIDSLIGSWQARVRETRAPSEDLTIGITIMSLAWATGMGALSLRSSRWR